MPSGGASASETPPSRCPDPGWSFATATLPSQQPIRSRSWGGSGSQSTREGMLPLKCREDRWAMGKGKAMCCCCCCCCCCCPPLGPCVSLRREIKRGWGTAHTRREPSPSAAAKRPRREGGTAPNAGASMSVAARVGHHRQCHVTPASCAMPSTRRGWVMDVALPRLPASAAKLATSHSWMQLGPATGSPMR